ncbi:MULTISPECIES: YncE family protein [unclassified Phenylobacterium]|uniref:YncE family protein n=1 Tax=unclassified Phenylobacterium TaxID=2640670 RepID=UPI0018D1F8FD|nr:MULTISPECIES: YncE family protein [unclassified Phenylobacterium]
MAIALAQGSAAQAGGASANGDRLAMVTYWGDDRVALLDTQGQDGKEEVWSIDVLKAAGCPKPYDVRVNAAGSRAYVSCSGGDEVIAVDIVAQLVEWKVKTGKSPRDLQLYDGDKKLLVANSGSDTVSVVDVENRKVLYEIPVGLQPYGVALAQGGKLGLITGWASGDLHVLELGGTSGRVLGKVKVGLLPYTVVAPKDGSVAYVAANGDHSVVAVDVAKRVVVKSQPVGRNPWSIATNPEGTRLLVANNRSGNLSLMDAVGEGGASSFTAGRLLDAGAVLNPSGVSTARAAKNVALTADGKTGIFTDLANNQVVVVDTTTGQIKKAIAVGKAPYGIEMIRPVN